MTLTAKQTHMIVALHLALSVGLASLGLALHTI
jgi:hypothetical protein